MLTLIKWASKGNPKTTTFSLYKRLFLPPKDNNLRNFSLVNGHSYSLGTIKGQPYSKNQNNGNQILLRRSSQVRTCTALASVW